MASLLIKCKDITKEFNLGKTVVHALRGVDVEIKKGEYVSIMGASGSGKSTLMHILGCLDSPTSGEYYFDSKLISNLSDDELALIRNEQIGFVFQNFNLLPRLSAAQNIELPLLYNTGKKNNHKDQIIATLRKVGLSDRANHHPNELSGGECQRVAIARALINDPSILFADEPTGNLDSRTGEEIMSLFDGLAAEGHTIVLVTHDRAIAGHTKRVITLRDGKVVSG